jgi:hypothetical protein
MRKYRSSAASPATAGFGGRRRRPKKPRPVRRMLSIEGEEFLQKLFPLFICFTGDRDRRPVSSSGSELDFVHFEQLLKTNLFVFTSVEIQVVRVFKHHCFRRYLKTQKQNYEAKSLIDIPDFQNGQSRAERVFGN